MGRFSQIDPASELYSYSSPYSYVLNNPIKLIDPTGMTTQTIYDFDGNAWVVDCENGECGNARRAKHEVEKDDTFYGIANRNYDGEISVDDLRKWNPGVDENDLQVGQQINLVPLTDIQKDELVRWIADRIDTYGVDPNDPVVLNVISSSINWNNDVWKDIKVNQGRSVEGAGMIGQTLTAVFTYEAEKLILGGLIKKGVSKGLAKSLTALVGYSTGTAIGLVFAVLDPTSVGAQSKSEKDRGIRARSALKEFVKSEQ